jgi:glycosyltransferase involved in cell wall biosynthesis
MDRGGVKGKCMMIINKSIGIVSVHPKVHSGYGVQCNIFCDMFTRMGYDVSVYSIFGNSEYIDELTYNGKIVKVYPSKGQNVWSNFSFYEQIENPDIYWGISDGFILRPEIVKDKTWVQMYMADTEPLHPNNLVALPYVHTAIGLTDWSVDVIKKSQVSNNVIKFPLLVDKNAYTIKEDAKEWFFNTFKCPRTTGRIFSFVGANVGKEGIERKNIPLLLQWFDKHNQTNPDDYLYIHTELFGGPSQSEGYDIAKLINIYISRPTQIRYANPANYAFGRFSSDYMSSIYSASDAMIVPSYSEGFGVPYCEAGMCGCPPIGLDFGAGGEVIKNIGGYPVKCTKDFLFNYVNKANTTIEDLNDSVNLSLTLEREELRENTIKYYSIESNYEQLQKIVENLLSD